MAIIPFFFFAALSLPNFRWRLNFRFCFLYDFLENVEHLPGSEEVVEYHAGRRSESYFQIVWENRPWVRKQQKPFPWNSTTVDSISYVLFFVWKNKIARLSYSLQIFRRALSWSHLFPTVWMRSLAQKIMGFLSTRLSLPCFFGRFEWKIENKKYT